jgi:pantoate--beta-alanine ligase
MPTVDEMYPAGSVTTVSVTGPLTQTLDAVHRPGHFDGVTTIVAKLLNIVSPDVVYFGQKDAQQAVVIRRMVADLEFPVLVEVCPTVREPDGLALSSRNIRLSPEERGRATALHRSLSRATKLARDGEREASAILAAARTELDGASIDPDYLELVDAETLAPVARLNGRPALAVVAARVGDTRLIDNEPLGGD